MSEPEDTTVKQNLACESMLKGTLTEQVSCLTMAPSSDILLKNVDTPSRRLPLKECNNELSPVPKVSSSPCAGAKPQAVKAISNVPKGLPGFLSFFTSGSMPVMPKVPITPNMPVMPKMPVIPNMPNKTTEECSGHLHSLAQQLHTLLFTRRLTTANTQSQTNLEELTNPAAQPSIWISTWVDNSEKYGFGYQLCNNMVGVLFNDLTHIVLLPNKLCVRYRERTGKEYYYTKNSTPPEIKKKMLLLSYFQSYMTDHLIKAGASHVQQECDRLTRVPYMKSWKRTSKAVTMHLSNGTVQVNFMNHTKVIVCPLMSAVTIIDDKKKFCTYQLSTLESFISQPQFSLLAECLNYTYKKIPELIASERHWLT